MNLSDYINPVVVENTDFEFIKDYKTLMFNIVRNTAKNPVKLSSRFQIAILGVTDDRNSNNKGAGLASDIIRNELYKLYKPASGIKIVDLGNLKNGETVKDTYAALTEIVYQLLKKKIIPIIIGGTQEHSLAIFKAYERLKKVTNIVAIDSRFDIGESSDQFDSVSYLSNLVNLKSKFLFNYSNIGYQTYYVPQVDIELMHKMYFDTIRLGQARTDLSETEPILRDSDFVSLDISAVKSTDAPANYNPSIHGFLGDEICLLAKYAGASDRLSSFGIFEINPKYDIQNKTSQLAAQIIWHFIQGFSMRKKEFPDENSRKYKKFIVSIQSSEYEMIFYKSKKTMRWWIEIPYTEKKEEKKIIVSCSKSDYMQASSNDIPDIWWKYYQKLN